MRGETADAAHGFVTVERASDISLNLLPGEVVSMQRQGGDLVLELANGETITLQGYFAGDLAAERLKLPPRLMRFDSS